MGVGWGGGREHIFIIANKEHSIQWFKLADIRFTHIRKSWFKLILIVSVTIISIIKGNLCSASKGLLHTALTQLQNSSSGQGAGPVEHHCVPHRQNLWEDFGAEAWQALAYSTDL